MSARRLPSLCDYDAWDYTGTYTITSIDLRDGGCLTLDTIGVEFD